MTRSFLQLACVAAIGLLAASAYAQYTLPSTASPARGAPAMTSPSPADAASRAAPGSMTSAPDASVLSTLDASAAAAKAQADADFRAARMACNAKTITDRDDCLRIAKENYIRALDETGNNSIQDENAGANFYGANPSERGPGGPSAPSSVPSGTASDGDVTGNN